MTCTTPEITVRIVWDDGDPGEYLEIPPDCQGEGIWWNVLEQPAFDVRYTNAPPSEYVPGETLLRAVSNAAAVTLGVGIKSSTVNGVEALKTTLANALAHFPLAVQIYAETDYGSGPVTEIIGAWWAKPAIPIWGPVNPNMYSMFAAEGGAIIPVNPAGAP